MPIGRLLEVMRRRKRASAKCRTQRVFLFRVIRSTARRFANDDSVGAPFLSRQRILMRVPLLLMALATTPFVAAAAQNGSAAVKDPAQCAVADANRSPQSWLRDRKPDPQGRSRTGCSPVTPSGGTTGDPPPPPDTTPPPPPPPPPGSVSIDGTVYNEATWGGLQGWTVTISGPVNSSTVTDATGHYVFSGIPAGTYTVCEAVQSGWTQSSPTMPAACPSGRGYNFPLTAGGSGSFVDFGNMTL